jgi:hypothetical protein
MDGASEEGHDSVARNRNLQPRGWFCGGVTVHRCLIFASNLRICADSAARAAHRNRSLRANWRSSGRTKVSAAFTLLKARSFLSPSIYYVLDCGMINACVSLIAPMKGNARWTGTRLKPRHTGIARLSYGG